jgi:hypothetical protein
MDDVGIGKTLQVVGLVALLAYYREYYARHHRFPGKLGQWSLDLHSFSSTHGLVGQGGSKWPGDSDDGNIPDSPFIIVVPTSLISQFPDECRRYLQPQSFDLLTYTGTLRKREFWWSTVFDASHHRLWRRIVIATTSVQYSCILSLIPCMSDLISGHRVRCRRYLHFLHHILPRQHLRPPADSRVGGCGQHRLWQAVGLGHRRRGPQLSQRPPCLPRRHRSPRHGRQFHRHDRHPCTDPPDGKYFPLHRSVNEDLSLHGDDSRICGTSDAFSVSPIFRRHKTTSPTE